MTIPSYQRKAQRGTVLQTVVPHTPNPGTVSRVTNAALSTALQAGRRLRQICADFTLHADLRLRQACADFTLQAGHSLRQACGGMSPAVSEE